MERYITLPANLLARFESLRQQAVTAAQQQSQSEEALIERARLNVYMENFGKLPGGIISSRAEGVIKSFYGKEVPDDAIDREILGFYEANLALKKMQAEGGFVLSKDSILKLYREIAKYEHEMTEAEKTGFRTQEAYTHGRSILGKNQTTDYALPKEIEPALDKLIEDCQSMQAAGVNLLIIAAIFHVEFEAIHPFKDCNGRLGRLFIYAMLGEELGLGGNLVLEKHIVEGNHKNTYINRMNQARGVTPQDEGTLVYSKISERTGDAERFVEYFADIYEAALKSPVQAKAAAGKTA